MIAYGALFGFLLSRAGATDFDVITGMFRLTDLHILHVIGLAVAVAAAGLHLFRRGLLRPRTGAPAAIETKPWTPGLVAGALLFGVGWALSGTCPGTSLAQIGEGRLAGLVTFAGILLGAWLASLRAPARVRQPSGC
jgi:uncharacterized membrane protein YedE/YeeE